jgi:hypothetical protein
MVTNWRFRTGPEPSYLPYDIKRIGLSRENAMSEGYEVETGRHFDCLD